jgi:hypothetical protein
MGTFWDNFLNEYSLIICKNNFPLITILEAFWYYTINDFDECKKILKIIHIEPIDLDNDCEEYGPLENE